MKSLTMLITELSCIMKSLSLYFGITQAAPEGSFAGQDGRRYYCNVTT
jgi:hypothetical protein